MTALSESVLSRALLPCVRDGSYPDKEEIITAELSAPSIASILHELDVARHEHQTDIQQLSQGAALDVDVWIAQAKELQEDIVRSRATARQIVREHDETKLSTAEAVDFKAKAILLREEIDFNNRVVQILDYIKSIDDSLLAAEDALAKGDLLASATEWEGVQLRLEESSAHNAQKMIQDRLSELREVISGKLDHVLCSRIVFDDGGQTRSLNVVPDTADSSTLSMGRCLEALQRLGALDRSARSVSKNMKRAICQPVLAAGPREHASSIFVKDHRLEITCAAAQRDAHNVLECINTIIGFMDEHLPEIIKPGIASAIIPDLISTIIDDWLTPSIPLELSKISELQSLQTSATKLAELLLPLGWPGSHDLLDWVKRAPRLWLSRRRISSLDGVRKAFSVARGLTKQVERVERQTVSKEDVTYGIPGEAVEHASGKNDVGCTKQSKPTSSISKAEEDDISGWDFEVNDHPKGSTSNGRGTVSSVDEDDSAEAWGWDDENADNGQRTAISSEDFDPDKVRVNGSQRVVSSGRVVILKETYTITDIPDSVLDIIGRDIEDSESVRDPQYSVLHSTPPSAGLLALPGLVLAMFRATATTYYSSKVSSGNMRLYNDPMYMAERLRGLITRPELAKVQEDIGSLEKFAKNSYGHEMEVQRTVLGDLLDGAQGFTKCTQYPYSTACETAVSSVVDRIKGVHQEWRSILSHSALLQSTGSLTATVMGKIIKDIEDMEDISEPESHRLATFCNQVSKLDDLFLPEQATTDQAATDAEKITLTALYVSNWLKFQYLANILESSLVDIKYLWTQGELSLEFQVEEVIDLIRALFAESTHRRNAIAEIRRAAR